MGPAASGRSARGLLMTQTRSVQTGGQFPQLQIPKPPRKGGKTGKKGC